MAEFEVHGPFDLEVKKFPTGGLAVDGEAARQFLKEKMGDIARGCYVLAVRGPNGGETPIYVGKAVKAPLYKESTMPRNINFINKAINEAKKRKACIYFVAQIKGRGKWNAKQIGEVEEYLIANAAKKNKNLCNTHLLPQDHWRIKGVVASKAGENTTASSSLRRALGI